MSAASAAAATSTAGISASSCIPLPLLRRHSPAQTAGCQVIQRRLQLRARGGQVLQELDVPIEVNDEGLVLVGAHQVVEEAVAGGALLVQHAPLAHAGVHQQPERERKVGLFSEIADGFAAGRPAASLKSSLVRLLTIWPCLSRTVARTLTTLTSEEKVGVSWAARAQHSNPAAGKTTIRPLTCRTRTGAGMRVDVNVCIFV